MKSFLRIIFLLGASLSLLPAAHAASFITDDFRVSVTGPDGDAAFLAGNPSAVHNPTNDEFFVVWASDDSVDNEYEIYGRRLDSSTGEPLGDAVRISTMGPDGDPAYVASAPSVAYNSGENEYLVVWMGEDDSGSLVNGEFEIYGQRIDAATGAEIGNDDFRISDMGPDGSSSFFASSPDVAYNAADDEYLVVWTADDDTAPLLDNEFEVHGQRLDAKTGAELGDNDFRISDMGPDGDTAYGAVSARVAYDSVDSQYLVVWQGDDGPVDNQQAVYGQVVDAATGDEKGMNDFPISDLGQTQPRLAYNVRDNDYLVVFVGNNPSNGLGTDVEILGQRIDAATGAEVGANDFRISDMGPISSTDYWAQRPNVTYSALGNEYLVVWTGDDDTAPLVDEEFEIFAQRLDAATGAEMGENDFRVSAMGQDGDVAFRADNAAAAFSSARNRYLVVWDGDDDAAPLADNEFEILGRFLNFPSCGNGVVDSGEACDDGNMQSGDGCSDSCSVEPHSEGSGTTGDDPPTGGSGPPASPGGCSLIR